MSFSGGKWNLANIETFGRPYALISPSKIKSSRTRTINRRPRLTNIFHVLEFLWDVKEPTHYSRRVGDEVPGVVAVLRECMGGWG